MKPQPPRNRYRPGVNRLRKGYDMEGTPTGRPAANRAELPAEDAPLVISPASVVHVIARAKAMAVKDVVTEPEPGSNPTDDGMVEILEDHPDDPVDEELQGFIDNLGEDEQIDLVALAWLGRDDGSVEEWPEVRRQAAEAHNDRTASYLLGMPLLADFLEAGLSTLGYSVEELESDLLS